MDLDIGFVARQTDYSPELSVIICTRDRLSKLKRCVDSLLSVSTAHQWELVVVDNASTDGTGEFLASINQKQFDRVCVTTTFEQKCGLAVARNKGWPVAKAGLVAFTDDDCYVAENYVESVVQVFGENPEAGFLGGRILLFDPADYRITIQESEEQNYFWPGQFVAAGLVQGANMAFRKTTLERIGGFDERLGAGTPFPTEDIDAVTASLLAGIPGLYDPRPLVYHHHGRKTEGDAQKLMRSYDAGRGAFYAKYILRPDSRSEFVRAWLKSLRKESLWHLRQGRLPRNSLRELSSGLRFAVRGWLGNKPST